MKESGIEKRRENMREVRGRESCMIEREEKEQGREA
jgi:hypothetical protein